MNTEAEILKRVLVNKIQQLYVYDDQMGSSQECDPD